MIHTQLESALRPSYDAEERRGKIDKSTFQLKVKNCITFSSTLNEDQLRKACFAGPFYLWRNIGVLALTLISATLVGAIAYGDFFANIRLDYGDVATYSDCHMVPFNSIFPQAYDDDTPFQICDTVTHETRNYSDATTDFKNGFRIILGSAAMLYAVSLLWRAIGRFRVIRKDWRAHRSTYSDIVKAFDIDGYQWDVLAASIRTQYDLFDGTHFTDPDQPWDMVIDALTKNNDLGHRLDEPVSKYLGGSNDLALDEQQQKPYKEDRDAAMAGLGDKAAIKIFPMLVAEVNQQRRAEEIRRGVDRPDNQTLEETNRTQEEINAAAHIAAVEQVVI